MGLNIGPAETGNTYTTSGTTWTSGSGKTGQYCVSGDILYYRENAADGGTGLLYVLKRK